MAEAQSSKKANVRCLPNAKKGYLLVVFEVPGIKPALMSKKKASNGEVDVKIPEAPGDFGTVKVKNGDVYLLEALADDFGSSAGKWDLEGSHYEVAKDELHVFLKN